jgi:hypothetical protein
MEAGSPETAETGVDVPDGASDDMALAEREGSESARMDPSVKQVFASEANQEVKGRGRESKREAALRLLA